MAEAHVPLSRRTPTELLAKAAQLREMAATASTQDVKNALLRLADRYATRAVTNRRLLLEQAARFRRLGREVTDERMSSALLELAEECETKAAGVRPCPEC